jgi:hypothetical protein
MAAPFIQGNFAGGELSPDLWGHVDLARYHMAAATARNLFVNYRGGFYSRAGTALVGRCKQAPPAAPPRDISFQFSLSQSYALEFGDNYMRVKTSGAYVLEASKNITGATQANPCQITSNAHGYSNGDWLFIQGVSGMTQLNGNTYVAAGVAANTFTLHDLDGNNVDSTFFGVYTAGGTVARLFTLATPYAAADLPYLKFTQSADVLSLTLVNLATGTEYKPQELSRLAANNWTIAALSLGSTLAAPGGLTGAASNHPDPAASPKTQPCAYAYEVTAVDLRTGQESNPSSRVDVVDTVDMGVTAGSVTVGWNPVAGAGQYNIYRTAPNYNTKPADTAHALPAPAGSFFFFAGSAYGTQFVDTNTVTDAGKTPPLHHDPFARGQILGITVTGSAGVWTVATVGVTTGTGSGFVGEAVIVGGNIVAVIVINPGHDYLGTDSVTFAGDGVSATATLSVGKQSGTYPAVVAYFQQRRIYAQSLNQPDTFFASQSGRFTNFDSGNPPSDTDAITASPFSQVVNGIQWLLPMPGGLVVLTGSSAWQLTGTGGSALNPQPLTPSSEQAQSQAFNGCSGTVPPIRINYNILYVGARGSFPYELNYNVYFNIYYANDIGWPSAHLFQNHQILQWAWQEAPFKLIWAVREDGALLSLAYVKEQEVTGWTRHDTQGLVKGVCTVTEPVAGGALYLTPLDALYLIVQRWIGGVPKYFSERMDSRNWATLEDSWCVDCGLSTRGLGPNASLFASASVGSGVSFIADQNVFSVANVGMVIRMGGGIARIDAYVSPTTVTGTWVRPLVQTLPGDPNGFVLPAPPQTWSVLAQLNSVGGLGHLKGKTVVGLADGVPIGPLTVANDGTVALPFAASLVTMGLQFTAQFQSLYIEPGTQPTVQGRRKAINAVTARVVATGWAPSGTNGLGAAANESDGSALDPPQLAPLWSGFQALKPTPPGAAPPNYQNAAGQTVTPLFTGDLRVNIKSEWKKPGQVAIQQNLPLPFNLTAIVPEYLEGDTPELGYSQRPAKGQRAA